MKTIPTAIVAIVVLFVIVAASAYYFYQQQSNTASNAAQDAQCQSLGSEFYAQQQAQEQEDDAHATKYSLGVPYYEYKSELDACIYVSDINYDIQPGSYGDTIQLQLIDLTHGGSNNIIAEFDAPYGSDVASGDQSFCKTFNELFGSDMAKYRSVGVGDDDIDNPFVGIIAECATINGS
jgi:hypothetical protein